MPSYLIETYSTALTSPSVEAAIRELADGSGGVQFVRATFVPNDEMSFHFVSAPSADVVREALQRAGIAFERVVEAVE